MKKLNFKFFGLLIIFIYCLAPLCAVDFGHDNNNSGNDAQHIEDKKIGNMTVKLKLDTNNDSKAHNVSQSLKGENIGLNAEIDSVQYGETPVLKVWCTNDDFYNTMDAVITVSGDNYSSKISVKIKDRQINEYELGDDLPAGNYTVSITTVPMSGYWDSATVTNNFTVSEPQ